MPYTSSGPHQVDLAGATVWGVSHGPFGAGNYPGPHVRGAERYVCWFFPTAEATADLRIFRSPDAGVSWAPQDLAAMPELENTVVGTERLGADTMRVCYGGNAPETLALGVPVVRDFDFVANTLGPALFTCDAFAADNPHLAGYHRSTVAAEDRIFVHRTSPFIIGTRVGLYRHDGTGFLAPLLVSDNVLLPNTKRCILQAIFMDPAGMSHVLYSEQPRLAPFKPKTVYYRQIDAAGNMTVPVVVYTYNFLSTQAFGFPALAGNLLVCPFPFENGTSEADQYWTGAVLVVDPYTSPTPTITPIAIPTQRLTLETTAFSGSINASTLGTQVYLWWLEELGLDGVTPLSRIMYSTYDGGAIPAPVVFHDELASPSFDPQGQPMLCLSPPFMDVADPMLLVGMSGFIGGIPIGPTTFYWFSVPGPPGAPAVLRSEGFRRSHLLIPNKFDHCLIEELQAHQNIQPARACCKPLLWRSIVWIRAPKNFRPFRKLGAVPTPLAITGDVEVLAFDVPTGYDGVIAAVFHVYTGPGFQEGNGDLEWRVKLNRVYAVQLGRVMVTLGSRAQGFPVDGGIPIQSGQRISYIVSAPNLSGGILPLASQVVCGVEGLFYART